MCEKADVRAHIEPSRETPPGMNFERDAKETLIAQNRPQPLQSWPSNHWSNTCWFPSL